MEKCPFIDDLPLQNGECSIAMLNCLLVSVQRKFGFSNHQWRECGAEIYSWLQEGMRKLHSQHRLQMVRSTTVSPGLWKNFIIRLQSSTPTTSVKIWPMKILKHFHLVFLATMAYHFLGVSCLYGRPRTRRPQVKPKSALAKSFLCSLGALMCEPNFRGDI